MLQYKKLYFTLFNAVTDGINALEHFDGAKALHILKQAQINCEELYMNHGKKERQKNK